MNIGILIFQYVEVLDFCGPLETFSVINDVSDHKVNVFTIAKNNSIIHARSNLKVEPNYDFKNHPKLDILIIPGGIGTRKLLNDDETLKWIYTQHIDTKYLLSVCTGALLLAKLGLLLEKKATTHHTCFHLLEDIDPTITIIKNQRFVDEDKIVTSGGISAGIDLSFYMIEKIWGKDLVNLVAKEMEYDIN
jgi:transcriptional regulator GlxA family with amidase domain